MARKGEGMRIPTTRSAYTNPANNGYPRVATRAPRSAVGGGGGPMYAKKMGGIAERQQFSDVAAQASADNQLAIPVHSDTRPYYANRNLAAVSGAGQQSVLHWNIRDRMQARDQEAYEFDQRQMMDLARMAIEGNFREAELQLRAMGMDEQVRQYDENRQDRNYWESVGVNQRETSERRKIADRATDRAQRGYEFEENKKIREAEIASRDRSTRRANRNRSAVADQRRQDAANKAIADAPGYWQNQAEAAGYDLSPFEVVGGSGEVLQKRFDDTVKALLTQNPNANPNDIIRQAAEQTGLELREGVDAPIELPWDPPQQDTGRGRRRGNSRRDKRSAVGDGAAQEPMSYEDAIKQAKAEGLSGGKATSRALDLQEASGAFAPQDQTPTAQKPAARKPVAPPPLPPPGDGGLDRTTMSRAEYQAARAAAKYSPGEVRRAPDGTIVEYRYVDGQWKWVPRTEG